MGHDVVVIPGDGIGPEVVDAARRVLAATGVDLRWEVRQLGLAAADRSGDGLPDVTLEAIRSAGACLKGPCATPPRGPLRSVNVALRQALDLYACVRPCRLFPGVPSPYEAVDVVVIRENTEDLYTGVEFPWGGEATGEVIRFVLEAVGERIPDDSGISIKANSIAGSERIARFAFAYARERGRRTVTVGHKANIMKRTDGLFLEAARTVAGAHPDVRFEERIIDALAMQLVQRPEAFDVLLLPNLYGDVISELCAGLVGGPGLAPGAHLGDGLAVFEATHGTAPRLAGTGRANPMALILCGAMLLRHLGEEDAARRVESAVAAVLAEGRTVTPDLRPAGLPATTGEVAEAVAARVRGPGPG
ncbi:MAG TPA: isocitrate/isopropylmalate dehydrogenase family protein [Actinomycetota bacterium]|nr:isocitrate/isopropylmalate dehydrogenase family protein [Actinomycetota bacterium]